VSVSSVRSQLRNQLRESVSVAILEAAEDLIAAKGLQGAPLAQIAKRAGVAVGTLYNYFEDRDALIRALFEMRRQTLRPQIKAAIAKHADLAFEPRLRAFLHEVFEVFEAHRKFIKVLFEAEHLKKSPATTPQDLALAISALVEAGVSEGVLDDKHAELLPTVIGGALRGILVRRIDENRKLSPDDTDALVSIVLDGTRK
jgi:AcrR family transcriptional regulator